MDASEKMKKRSNMKRADANYRAKIKNGFDLIAKALGMNQNGVQEVSKLDMLLQAKFCIKTFDEGFKKMLHPGEEEGKMMLDEVQNNYRKLIRSDAQFFRRTISPDDVGSIFDTGEGFSENNKTGENNCTQPIMNDAAMSSAQSERPSNVVSFTNCSSVQVEPSTNFVPFPNCSEHGYTEPNIEAMVFGQRATEDTEMIPIENAKEEGNRTQPITNRVVISSTENEPSTNLILFTNCSENGYTERNTEVVNSGQRATENQVIIPPYEGKKINPEKMVVGKRQKEASKTEVSMYKESTVGIRKRGRPKTKVSPIVDSAVVPRKVGRPKTKVVPIVDTAVVPRKRGRPKTKVAPLVDTAVVPRKRGRPKTEVAPKVDAVTSIGWPKTKISYVVMAKLDVGNAVKRKRGRPKTQIGHVINVKPPKRKIAHDRQNAKVVYPVHIQFETEDAVPKGKSSTKVPDSAIINVEPRFLTPRQELNAELTHLASVQLETEDVVPKKREKLQTYPIVSNLEIMPKGLHLENVHPTYVEQSTKNVISKKSQGLKFKDASCETVNLEMEDAPRNVGSIVKTMHPTHIEMQMRDEISIKRKSPDHTYAQHEVKEGVQKRLDTKVLHPAYIQPKAETTMPRKGKILKTVYPAMGRPKTQIGHVINVKPPKGKVVYCGYIPFETEDAVPKEKLSTGVPDSAIINVEPRFPTPRKELNAELTHPANVQLEIEDVVPKKREKLQTYPIVSNLKIMPKGLHLENVHPTYVEQSTKNVISKKSQGLKSKDASCETVNLEMEDAPRNVGSIVKTMHPTHIEMQMKDEISIKRKSPDHTYAQHEVKGVQKRLDTKVLHPAYLQPKAETTMPRNGKILKTVYPAMGRPKTQIGHVINVKPPKGKVVYCGYIPFETEDAVPKEKLSSEVPDSAIINVEPRFPTPRKELNAELTHPANVQLENEDVVPKGREKLQTHPIVSNLQMEPLMPKGLHIENVHPTYVEQSTKNVISKKSQGLKFKDASCETVNLEMEDAPRNVGSIVKTMHPTHIEMQMKDEISIKRKSPDHTYAQHEIKEGVQKRLDTKVLHPAYIQPKAETTMPRKGKILKTTYPAYTKQETIPKRSDVEASFDTHVKPEMKDAVSRENSKLPAYIKPDPDDVVLRENLNTDVEFPIHIKTEIEDAVQYRRGHPGTQFITAKGKHNAEDKLKDLSNMHSTNQRKSTKEITKSPISRGISDDKENVDINDKYSSILFSLFMDQSPPDDIFDDEAEDNEVVYYKENKSKSEFSKMLDDNDVNLQFLGSSDRFLDINLLNASTSEVMRAIEIEDDIPILSSPFKSYQPCDIEIIDLSSDDMDYYEVPFFKSPSI